MSHVILVSLGLRVLVVAGRTARASDRVVAGALLLVRVGALPVLTVIRVQNWALLFFPLLLLLVTAQARRPDRRIWWAPVLVAVWGNLPGAVLLGVCWGLPALRTADSGRPRPWRWGGLAFLRCA